MPCVAIRNRNATWRSLVGVEKSDAQHPNRQPEKVFRNARMQKTLCIQFSVCSDLQYLCRKSMDILPRRHTICGVTLDETRAVAKCWRSINHPLCLAKEKHCMIIAARCRIFPQRVVAGEEECLTWYLQPFQSHAQKSIFLWHENSKTRSKTRFAKIVLMISWYSQGEKNCTILVTLVCSWFLFIKWNPCMH